MKKIFNTICHSGLFARLAVLALVFVLSACSGGHQSLPAVDETGLESATQDETEDNSLRDPSSAFGYKLTLQQATNVRLNKNSKLEFLVELPAGTQILIPDNYQVQHLDYRNSKGELERSSTGFVTPLQILKVPTTFQKQFSPEKIAQLNKTSGGLFTGAAIVGSVVGVSGSFSAISSSVQPGEGFLKLFAINGRPKFSFESSVKKRFSARLNKAASGLSASHLEKYKKIYAQIRAAVDRTVATKKSYLMMDTEAAKTCSIDYEKSGTISPIGAWSIAVNATAVRHGFANVPCAEFQSEILRQAYQRAGYKLTDDFNSQKGNALIWSRTASVVGFSAALYAAGWVPWLTSKYRPPVGAFMMHGSGLSPGHTFIAAGYDGQLIVDNGAPQGRDLRKTSLSTLQLMFQAGVFFLPPGVNPKAW